MDKAGKTIFLLSLVLVLAVAIFIFAFSMKGINYQVKTSQVKPFKIEDQVKNKNNSKEYSREQQEVLNPPALPIPSKVDLEDELVYLNVSKCQSDLDCVPLPSECHPQKCINREFQNQFVKPDVCTQLFDEGAAYEVEDCLCDRRNGICFNQNNQKSKVFPN